MKKLLLSLIMLSVASTSFGMQDVAAGNGLIVNTSFNTIEIPNSDRPMLINGYWNRINVVNPNQPRRSWMPYLKIGAGLGCFGLSAWFCLKQDAHPLDALIETVKEQGGTVRTTTDIQPVVYYNNNSDSTSLFSPSIALGSEIKTVPGTRILSPQIALSKGAFAALITAVPGYLLVKSGLKDLRLEKQEALRRFAEQNQRQNN